MCAFRKSLSATRAEPRPVPSKLSSTPSAWWTSRARSTTFVASLSSVEVRSAVPSASNHSAHLTSTPTAIDVVWKEGVQGQSQLSMRLGEHLATIRHYLRDVLTPSHLPAIDPSTAAQLITRLRDEHFMVDKSASAAKGKGKHRAKKPQITISK